RRRDGTGATLKSGPVLMSHLFHSSALMRGMRGVLSHQVGRSAFVAAVVLVTSAHIGSPDAWYDGPAGPYHVLVHVVAPPVVPGIAVVNVRADDAGVQ